MLLIKHKVNNEEIINKELLCGKFIHKSFFERIIKYPQIEATKEGIYCYDNNGNDLLYPFHKKELTILNYQKAFPSIEPIPIEDIYLTSKIIKRLSSIISPLMYCKLEFRGKDKAIMVKFQELDTTILVMPSESWG